jgi:hypothetical protein
LRTPPFVLPVSNKCRCGRLFENGYWYNSKEWYDKAQPKEYYTLEHMANFAEGVRPKFAVVKTAASARPHGKSVIREVSATVENALKKAEQGDTIEFFGMSGRGAGESNRWKDSAEKRGVTIKLKGE